MSIAENEALASLRILVAIARADGTIHNDERKSLAAALERLELPGGLTVDKLLAEKVDIDAQLGELVSEDAREQIYRSAYFMAHADGTCTPDEQAILDMIAKATGTTEETKEALDRMFVGPVSGGRRAEPAADAIADTKARAVAVQDKILRYSILSAALGAFPIPGLAIATDLGVVALQLKMIRDIGGFWGHEFDADAAKSMLYGVGLGTGARLALNNLAKLVPGWGSVLGATTSFVSTYALGRVIDNVLARGGEPEVDAVRAGFRAAEDEAKAVYAGKEDVIIQSQRQHHAAVAELSQKLKDGQISRAEFDVRVAALA